MRPYKIPYIFIYYTRTRNESQKEMSDKMTPYNPMLYGDEKSVTI